MTEKIVQAHAPNTEFERERTRYLLASCRQSTVFGLCAGALITALVMTVNKGGLPVVWLTIYAVMCILRYVHLNHILVNGVSCPEKGARIALVHTAIAGLFWGVAPFAMGLPYQSAALTSLTISLAAIVFGGSIPGAVSKRNILAFLIPGTLGISSYHALHMQPESLYLAVLMLVFGGFIFSTCKRMGKLVCDQIKTAHSLDVQVKATARADAASEAKSQFLATMSHEIRTPMNGVLGFANILSDTPLTDHQKHCVGIIQSSGQSLMSILNDILDVSKIEAGALELEDAPFDLQSVLENCVTLFNAQARAKNIDLATYIDPNIPSSLMGDSERLTQVVTNLVNNAIKFTSEGAVGVSVHSVSSTLSEHSVRIEVVDTGVGIAQEKLAAIFDRFAQADNSTTRQFGGTGLGLAIAKQMTELMGGTIRVESAVGEGTKFILDLSFAVTSPPARLIADSLDMTQLPGKRVLILDDNDINLDYFTLQLTAYGMETVTAKSAAEALQILEDPAAHFDAAIIDHLMPDMDGFGFLRALQQSQQHKSTGLILSSSADMTTRAHAKAKGFHAVVPKPVRQDELVKALQRVMTPAPAKDDFDSLLEGLTPLPETAQNSAAAVTSLREDLPPQAPNKLRVLLVEDNPVNSQLVELKLKMQNIMVDVVGNGAEAVNAVKTVGYDLVLMDIRMPVMDGVEATRNIRASGHASANVPIIALTANVMADDCASYIEVGMNDYIAKPIDFTDLMSKVKLWGTAAQNGKAAELR